VFAGVVNVAPLFTVDGEVGPVPDPPVPAAYVIVNTCTARVTVTVYVLVVTPSCAVTTTVIVFEPTFNEIEPDAEPEFTAVPFTVIVASECVLVGVTVMAVVANNTLAE
jgi:hypothetical protein